MTGDGRPAPARGAALVVLAAALWGTSGTAQELGPAGISPPAVAAVRVLVGAFALATTVAVTAGPATLVAAARRGGRAVPLAAVAMTGFQLGFFGGVHLAGVAVGTLVTIGTAPVFAGLLELAGGRPPGPRWAVATAVTLAGAVLLVLPGAEGGGDPRGVGLALLGGVSYAGYTVASKRMLEAAVPPTAAMAVAFLGAAVLLGPSLPLVETAWLGSPRGLAVMGWLALVTVGVGYVLFARGLGGVSASAATTLTLAEPLTAALLAVVVLDERLSGPALVGALLVAAGLVVAGGGRPPPAPATGLRDPSADL